MKNIIFVLVLMLSGFTAHAQTDALSFQQYVNFFQTTERIITMPTADSVIFLNAATKRPERASLSCLTISSGVLEPTAADWSNVGGCGFIANKPSLATVATSGNYNDLSNKPAIPSATAFNFGSPGNKTIAINTAYQAADNTKASVITISPSCTNTTTVIAASACTLQVRQSASSGLTCSNGTVVSTWSSTIALGLVITQGNSFPVDVKLPIGGYFIICPSAGTFTLSAVEQSAG